jgi:predicted transcriptional regulator
MLESILNRGGSIKPTHLMYKSNLAHGQMHLYLEELVSKDFVKKTKKGDYDYILITDKGYEFMQKLKEIKEFERAFGL